MERTQLCIACHCLFDENVLFPVGLLHEDVHASVQNDYTNCSPESFICRSDLARYTKLLASNTSDDEKDNCHMFASQADIETVCTFKDRCSDILVAAVGSWSFLFWFCMFLTVWGLCNAYFLVAKPIDPYPYIFLNLILAVMSSLQAPIILMSQNRQAEIDRARSTYDYAIDLKAEMEIRQIRKDTQQILQTIKKQKPRSRKH